MQAPQVRQVPTEIQRLPLNERVRWARKSAGLSHDRLVERLGRSNRGHLIKIERGDHVPRSDLRDAIADATGVPRELFGDDDDEESSAMPLTRDEFTLLGDLMGRLGATIQKVDA